MTESIRILRTDKVSESDNLTRLFTELSDCNQSPDVGRINSLISSGQLAFYVALVDDTLAGMMSVIPYRTAVKNKLWIEDVCVLSDYRGMGLGRKLIEFAMSDSEEYFGTGTFWLTSRPSRTAARNLYKSLGFKEYNTGIFFK